MITVPGIYRPGGTVEGVGVAKLETACESLPTPQGRIVLNFVLIKPALQRAVAVLQLGFLGGSSGVVTVQFGVGGLVVGPKTTLVTVGCMSACQFSNC